MRSTIITHWATSIHVMPLVHDATAHVAIPHARAFREPLRAGSCFEPANNPEPLNRNTSLVRSCSDLALRVKRTTFPSGVRAKMSLRILHILFRKCYITVLGQLLGKQLSAGPGATSTWGYATWECPGGLPASRVVLLFRDLR